MSLKAIRNADYVVLLCSNLKKTRAFYQEVMGFPIEHDPDNWVSFRVGATLLALRPRGQLFGREDGPVPLGTAAVQLAFRVPPATLDACHTELAAKGVAILRPPTDLPAWRHRTLFFRDPEGNLIGIYAEY
jgi:lactoylglutathione lyase